MGGLGSGRNSYFGAKDTTEDLRSFDIRKWHKEGVLAPNNSFNWQWFYDGEIIGSIHVHVKIKSVILSYQYRSSAGELEQYSYPVTLEWTPCNFGGKRPWFLCPVKGCGRRVAILYGGNSFSCRHCNQLAYQSQREPADERAIRQAEKIRKNLDWEPGVFNDMGNKPKGMHWNTYQRLINKYNTHTTKSFTKIAQFLGIFE